MHFLLTARHKINPDLFFSGLGNESESILSFHLPTADGLTITGRLREIKNTWEIKNTRGLEIIWEPVLFKSV